MEGLEALRLMRERAPGLRALLVSGYSEMPGSLAAAEDDRTLFLPKPFSNHALLDAVARMLSGSTR